MNEIELEIEFTCKECNEISKDFIVVDYTKATSEFHNVSCLECKNTQTYEYSTSRY
jgi:transcription elongation factor Elf1